VNKDSRIYVAGHNGLAGSAIVRALQSAGYTQLICRGHKELELADPQAVNRFFETERPEYVFLAAAKVGGILANDTYPADFLRDNLAIQLNTIDAAYRNGVRKLLFLGSSCVYPRLAPQPIPESALLTSPLESTNEWYAVAKIAGIKMIQAYRKQYGFRGISLMPTNLYGPGDNFDLSKSHVLPALLRKFHDAAASDAPEVVVWGSGTPLREFLHVDDFASAALHLMLHYDDGEIVNVGTGEDLSIAELAQLIGRAVGFNGRLRFDASKPDGTPRKLLDVSKLHASGWRARIGLEEGIRSTYAWYLEHEASVKGR
jgi:GDP-L-fucose synthase